MATRDVGIACAATRARPQPNYAPRSSDNCLRPFSTSILAAWQVPSKLQSGLFVSGGYAGQIYSKAWVNGSSDNCLRPFFTCILVALQVSSRHYKEVSVGEYTGQISSKVWVDASISGRYFQANLIRFCFILNCWSLPFHVLTTGVAKSVEIPLVMTCHLFMMD